MKFIMKISRVILSIILAIGIIAIGILSTPKKAEAMCSNGSHVYSERYVLRVYGYPYADNRSHQKHAEVLLRCGICGYSVIEDAYISEPHNVNSSTNRCECGFIPY